MAEGKPICKIWKPLTKKTHLHGVSTHTRNKTPTIDFPWLKEFSGWWFQPNLKNISQIESFPQFSGQTIKNVWHHQLILIQHPQTPKNLRHLIGISDPHLNRVDLVDCLRQLLLSLRVASKKRIRGEALKKKTSPDREIEEAYIQIVTGSSWNYRLAYTIKNTNTWTIMNMIYSIQNNTSVWQQNLLYKCCQFHIQSKLYITIPTPTTQHRLQCNIPLVQGPRQGHQGGSLWEIHIGWKTAIYISIVGLNSTTTAAAATTTTTTTGEGRGSGTGSMHPWRVE